MTRTSTRLIVVVFLAVALFVSYCGFRVVEAMATFLAPL